MAISWLVCKWMVCLFVWHLLVISLYLGDLRWVICEGILCQLHTVTHRPQVLIPDWFLLGANLEGVVMNSLQGYRVTSSVTGCVKSELRYPIILAIRSQWESQDLPALGNQYHVTDDTASQEQGYNTCAPNQG